MQFIRDIYTAKHAAGQPVISFEFSPPKTDEGDRNLLEKQIPALLQAKPDYCSVTYGAGGSTRDKTLMIVDRIQRQHGLIALLDPVITRPMWTAVVFDHEGMGEAMKGLFDDHWRRGKNL